MINRLIYIRNILEIMSETKVIVEVGDIFNETDDDVDFRVVTIDERADPPTALCIKNTKGNGDTESEDTEEEYALSYVEQCVRLRRE